MVQVYRLKKLFAISARICIFKFKNYLIHFQIHCRKPHRHNPGGFDIAPDLVLLLATITSLEILILGKFSMLCAPGNN